MKILYIITQADLGGAQKYVLNLAKHFNGSIACGNEKTELFNEAQKENIQTYQLKYLKRNIHPIFDILTVIEIIYLVKKVRPDIVHLNSSKAGLLGSLIKPFVNTKIIFTAHGFIFNEPSFFYKFFGSFVEKLASMFRDYIICVSEKDRLSALDKKIIPSNKITTVYNGIPPLNFLSKEEAKAKLSAQIDKIQIGSIANFYKTKGLDILIQAISILEESIKNKIEVFIIGDGTEKTNLELKIKNLNLNKIVRLTGKIENASKLLKAFEIFALPSRKEGFSFALLEAMQANLAIIATQVGGNNEALGGAGILIKPEKPKILADKITELVVNEKMRQTLALNALKRSELFTEEKMFSEVENIYKKLL
jgi:glycosyltransferase involved in cell wall biosynthesis